MKYSTAACLILLSIAFIAMTICARGQTQFSSCTNKGLVGVGLIAADTLDATGNDTLGGIGSSIWFDLRTFNKVESASGNKYTGRLYSISDAGYRGASSDYKPRFHAFDFLLMPYEDSDPVAQGQIQLVNTQSIQFTYSNAEIFTGGDPSDASVITFPQSYIADDQGNRRSLDPESLALRNNGTFYVGDEYGPFIYHFSGAGELLETLIPPPAYLPKGYGTYPKPIIFSTFYFIYSGRKANRGFEAMTITPDEKYLVAMPQSPLTQDNGTLAASVNTRLLVFDLQTNSTNYNQPVAEYVYQLGAPNGRQNLACEIRALNNHQFLVLERDDGGYGTSRQPFYKRVVLMDTDGATNILGTGYDREYEGPGQLALPVGDLPAEIVPVQRLDLVDLLDSDQLAKFGLYPSTLASKWEGMTLLPMLDTNAPDDYLLVIANDNDFSASHVIQNGVDMGQVSPLIDNMFLAFRVTLPGTAIKLPPPIPPQLTIFSDFGELIVSWPASPFPFVFECSTDPNGPWLEASEEVDSVDGINYAGIDSSTPARFFRVKINY
ncbi:MAG TPA: esterase-like activity of phytase family protein [Verrucomicrobiae bacterium]